jgi:hypothetical protein
MREMCRTGVVLEGISGTRFPSGLRRSDRFMLTASAPITTYP